jgi:Zn-dependent M28 family amino/carboxypeptidase
MTLVSESRHPFFDGGSMPQVPSKLRLLVALALTLAVVWGAPAPADAQAPAAAPVEAAFGQRPRIDGERMLADLAALAHDSLEGRRTGTPGAEKARAYLVSAFDELGLGRIGDRTHPFEFTGRGGGAAQVGVNVLGVVPGTAHPDRYIVVTAHYDHLGIRNDQIYNGADDNASGTAALLALAKWIRENPGRHSFVFVALDAEEMGLQGARAFVAEPPVARERIVMNVNLDMVSRSPAGELYAVGSYHYRFLAPLIAEAAEASRIELLTGHEGPGLPPGDDWTGSSDHAPFHQAGIPFVYFGVEDHPGYHQPTDDAEDITPAFYVEAIETALDFLLVADREGERILDARSP